MYYRSMGACESAHVSSSDVVSTEPGGSSDSQHILTINLHNYIVMNSISHLPNKK